MQTRGKHWATGFDDGDIVGRSARGKDIIPHYTLEEACGRFSGSDKSDSDRYVSEFESAYRRNRNVRIADLGRYLTSDGLEYLEYYGLIEGVIRPQPICRERDGLDELACLKLAMTRLNKAYTIKEFGQFMIVAARDNNAGHELIAFLTQATRYYSKTELSEMFPTDNSYNLNILLEMDIVREQYVSIVFDEDLDEEMYGPFAFGQCVRPDIKMKKIVRPKESTVTKPLPQRVPKIKKKRDWTLRDKIRGGLVTINVPTVEQLEKELRINYIDRTRLIHPVVPESRNGTE